jgi:hypothetical protein
MIKTNFTQIYAKTIVITFFYRKEQVYMSERKICKHQAFVITRVTFVDLQLLLADSWTIGSGSRYKTGILAQWRGGAHVTGSGRGYDVIELS